MEIIEMALQKVPLAGAGHDLPAASPEQLAGQHWQHFPHIAVQRCQGAFKREVWHFVLDKLRHGARLVQVAWCDHEIHHELASIGGAVAVFANTGAVVADSTKAS